MKKIMYFLVCLLLCVGIGGSAVLVYKTLSPEKTPTTENGEASVDDGQDGVTDFDDPDEGSTGNGSGSGDSSDSGSTDTGNTDVELTPPEDEVSYIAEGMEMLAGASVYMGDDETLDPAIRFTCLIDNELKAEVEADENKSFAILVAPLDYFDAVNTDANTYIDWVNAFSEAGKTVILSVYDGYGTYNDYTSYIRFTLSNVLYNNMNRRFVAMGVLVDNSGDTPTYKYSAMPEGQTYRTNARSVAYVAGAALNANALGEATIPETQVTKLQSYINMAVDKCNGLAEATDDGSMPEVTLTTSNSVVMGSGGTHQIGLELAPSALNVPARLVSSNESVATVSETGLISARGYGSATISIYICGEVYTVSVTVSSNVQYV